MADVNKKFLVGEVKGFNVADREVEAWFSRPVIDRDDEIILGQAWQKPDSLKNFRLNPVVLATHKYAELPIGKVVALTAGDDGLRGTVKFASTEAGNEAFAILSELGLAAFSVGFIPRGFKDHSLEEIQKAGYDISQVRSNRVRVYDHTELLEVSLVPVPSNPMATAIGRAYMDGGIKTKGLRDALKPWALSVAEARLLDQAHAEVERMAADGTFAKMVAARADEALAEIKKDTLNRELADGFAELLLMKIQETKVQDEQDKALAALKDVDMSDPEAVKKAYRRVDWQRVIQEKTDIALAKARGRVI